MVLSTSSCLSLPLFVKLWHLVPEAHQSGWLLASAFGILEVALQINSFTV